MRILFALVIALALVGDAQAIPPDKLSHFAFGVASGGVATAVVDQFAPDYRLVGGALLGTVPGLIVEIGDSTGKAGFSGTDLLADFIGSTVGALLTDKIILNFFFDENHQEKEYGVEVATTF